MATPPSQERTPTEEEVQAMTPSVLELQRLIMDRIRSAVTARPGLAAISCTSCDSNSCNSRAL